MEKDGISFINNITHRKKVFEEIKLFFRFKTQEMYILNLHEEITDIKLRCYEDLENMNLQVRNLTEEMWSRSDLRKNSQNMLENGYENNVYHGLKENGSYGDQEITSNEEFRMQQDMFIHPVYREGNENVPRKVEAEGELEKIDFNQLVQPAYKVSLNGSKIFLPPVKKANETTNELGKCLENVSQIREFIRNVSADRKKYVNKILQSHE